MLQCKRKAEVEKSWGTSYVLVVLLQTCLDVYNMTQASSSLWKEESERVSIRARGEYVSMKRERQKFHNISTNWDRCCKRLQSTRNKQISFYLFYFFHLSSETKKPHSFNHHKRLIYVYILHGRIDGSRYARAYQVENWRPVRREGKF